MIPLYRKTIKMKRAVLSMMTAVAFAAAAEPIIVTQAQLYPTREQARGYLGRYPTQPLLVEPDLPADPNTDGVDPIGGWGKFPGQADYDYTMKLIKSYDLDGLATFAGRHPRTFLSGETCPTKDYVQLPIFIWGKELLKKKKGKLFEGIETVLKAPHNLKIGGKIVLASYSTSATVEQFAQIRKMVTDKFGDKFLFMVSPGYLYKPRYEMWETGTVSEKTLESMKAETRKWLRVADGIGIGGTSIVTKRVKSERVSMTEYVRIMYEVMTQVRAEPEFKGKLVFGSAFNGHMNAYMRGYNCLEDCTRTYRSTFELPIEFGCDVIMIPEWDEYNENTAIMPTLYSSWTMRRLTRYFVAKAKGRALTPIEGDDVSVPNLVVSYRKSLSPGEHLVVEVLNIPDGSRKGAVKVAVEITDEHDQVISRHGPDTLEEDKMCEARYDIDTAMLAVKTRAPRVRLTYEQNGRRVTVADGLHAIDLVPANCWNHNAVKQAIRDQLKPVRAELSLTNGCFTADFAAAEPIRYAMLCGNGCIQYIQGRKGSAVERFREGADANWAVFQISPVCVGRHELKGSKRYRLTVKGVPEAEWLYVNSVSQGETLELDDINSHATPPIFLRVPKSRLSGLKLVADYLELFKGEVPLDTAYERNAYSVGASIKSMQVTVARFPLQARYPSVADSKEISFSVPVDADRNSMVYHAQLVGMSGRVWYSRPFVVEKQGGDAEIRLWNGLTERAETISVPTARIPRLEYDFAPGRGNVIVPKCGERHWFGMLGGPYSSATLWNRGARTEGAVDKPCAEFLNTCDDSLPKRVQEADGSWALEFDGVDDFANIPLETWPTFGGATIEVEVMLAEGQQKHGTIWANMFGLFDLGVEPDGEMTLGFWSGEGAMSKKGGRLEPGRWTRLRLVNDCTKLTLTADGKQVVTFPIKMPNSNTMGVMLGGFPVRNLGFFKGRMRNLSVRHTAE